MSETQAIYELSQAVAYSFDVKTVLDKVAHGALQQCAADEASIMLPTPDGKELYVAAVCGDPRASLLGTRVPLEAGIAGWVARHGEPLQLDGPIDDPRFAPLWPRADICSALSLPMYSGNKFVGVLNVSTTRSRQPFTGDQIKALSILTSIAATALENTRLFNQVQEAEGKAQKQLQRLAALHSIDLAITGGTDLNLVLNVLLDQVIGQLQVDAADILLLNQHAHMLEYATGRGFHTPALQNTPIRPGEGHAGRAVLERRTLQVPNLAEEGCTTVGASLLASEAFVSYFAVPLIAKGQVKGVLEVFHRARLQPDQEWLNFLDTLAGQAAIAVDNVELFTGLQRSYLEISLAYDATIEGWSRALDLRDKETEGHTQRVTKLTMQLAQELGMSRDELAHVYRGALLHDIGKMGVPDSILLKPGPLTPEEWEIMRRHPRYAYELLLPIQYLRPALDIPYYHHEKWDGTGYPQGLKGEQIPLVARLFAVVDVWDALTSDRPYRPAWSRGEALAYLREQAGRHFDPQVVEVFLRIMGQE